MISIPPSFSRLLNGLTDEISAAVGLALSSVGPILERNEAVFFPDYTDHGSGHIESVLKSCELLLSEEAWRVFTRDDVAVLILSVLSHDLGMLIDIEGFKFLVDPNRNLETPINSNDERWSKLWREFQLEVRRMDGPTLINILGSSDPISLQELDLTEITERTLKIIGEFLRRFHHRVAQEILVFGWPSERGRIVVFSQDIPHHLKDLAGRIARSHGVNIRECIDSFIEIDRNAHRDYRHVHPTFLMALLRLSDYIDLNSSRAPSSILSAKSLKSPISRREWWSNNATLDCHSNDDDPECLYVVIDPISLPDVHTLATIEEKLDCIQDEFDSCWAVLGETYGRFPPLSQFTLRIRRIRSDIREASKIKQLPFVPHRAALSSSRADLLKLLIEPLYGNNPGIGVRELVQNAVDAVREFCFVSSRMAGAGNNLLQNSELEADVVVKIEKSTEGDFWIEVADKGIGMTWETVCKYYLTAGASFRQSGIWKKVFTGESGEAYVLRSGRFGIGVLAAFLLGDRIKVSTRHMDEPDNKGLEFEFGLDDTHIEMRWKSRPVGTTVRVKTDGKIVQKLLKGEYESYPSRWDWYSLEKPSLMMKNSDGKSLAKKYRLPKFEEKLPIDWHSINVPGFQNIFWTFKGNVPYLTCNGILISDARISLYEHREYPHIRFDNPRVAVFDPDGYLPLNLARDDLARKPVELVKCLKNDVIKNFIAFSLCKGPNKPLHDQTRLSSYSRILDYSGAQWGAYNWYFSRPDGFGLVDPWNIYLYSSSIGLILRIRPGEYHLSKDVTEMIRASYGYTLGINSDNTYGGFDRWFKGLIQFQMGINNDSDVHEFFKGIPMKGCRVWIAKDWYHRFLEKQAQYIVSSHNIETETEDSVIFTVGDCREGNNRLALLAEEFRNNKISVESLVECYLSPETQRPEPGSVAQMWKDTIQGPIIPYEQEERKKIIERLEESFRPHLEQWSTERVREKL